MRGFRFVRRMHSRYELVALRTRYILSRLARLLFLSAFKLSLLAALNALRYIQLIFANLILPRRDEQSLTFAFTQLFKMLHSYRFL